ncbi:MAG: hypothetical protein Q9180_003366 [Flavoplaca navasiana]
MACPNRSAPSNFLGDTNSPGPLTNAIGLGVLLAITAGGGSLAVALFFLGRWRRKDKARKLGTRRPSAMVESNIYDAAREKARKKRMQKMKNDVEMGFRDTEEGDRWRDHYKEYRCEDFEEEQGLGIHFVDVDLSK